MQLFLKYWKELGSKPLDNQPAGYMLSYLEVLILNYLIVGKITDEHDVEEDRYIFEHSKGFYGVKALTPIENINEFFSTQYNDTDFETFGGLVLSKFGHLPKKGEKIEFDKFKIEVLRADRRRLHLLNVSYCS